MGLLADSGRGWQRITDREVIASEHYDIKVYCEKTHTVVVSKTQ